MDKRKRKMLVLTCIITLVGFKSGNGIVCWIKFTNLIVEFEIYSLRNIENSSWLSMSFGDILFLKCHGVTDLSIDLK